MGLNAPVLQSPIVLGEMGEWEWTESFEVFMVMGSGSGPVSNCVECLLLFVFTTGDGHIRLMKTGKDSMANGSSERRNSTSAANCTAK